MSIPRAFISFEMEDRWARDFLSQHAKDERNDIQFLDYSVKDPFDSKWKTNCKAKIALTHGTIVLIGKTTWRSEAVKWEIDETKRQGKFLLGIQINRDSTNIVPTAIPASKVIRWNFSTIVERLKEWSEQ